MHTVLSNRCAPRRLSSKTSEPPFPVSSLSTKHVSAQLLEASRGARGGGLQEALSYFHIDQQRCTPLPVRTPERMGVAGWCSGRVAQQMGDASSEADTLPGQLLPGQNATFPRHQMLGASGGRPAPPLLSPAPPLLSPARSLLSPHTPSPGQARGARRGAPVPEREVLWRGRGVAVLEGFFKGRHGTVFSILGDDVVNSPWSE